MMILSIFVDYVVVVIDFKEYVILGYVVIFLT